MAYSSIVKPSVYYNTKLYTGTGSSLSVTGVGFQPDWVWIKERNGATNHFLHDAVRGVTKAIFSNLDSAEDTGAQYLTAFGTDGFTVGTNGGINTSSDTYASWNWKANGAGSANTDGSTNSTVSVNTTAGFSIVKYAGADAVRTVGHGLGSVPKMIIVKRLGSTGRWQVYHSSLGATKYLRLDYTDAADTSSARWNDTEPTSSVFTLGTSAHVNESGDYVAYCFAEKKGYSKFGSYEGNGNADGTFVYTGFKPAFVLSKDTTGAGENWFIHDNKRDAFNPTNTYIRPNLTNSEGTAHHYNFFSNGFKNTYAGGSLNSSGRTYIYMAFAEEPLVANVGQSIPATAR